MTDSPLIAINLTLIAGVSELHRSAELLKEALPSADSVCLVCGPPQLVTDAIELLMNLGVREDLILTEKY